MIYDQTKSETLLLKGNTVKNKRLMKWTLTFMLIVFLGGSCTIFRNTKDSCTEKLKADCVCIEIYEPVCGCNEVTYSNSCKAECAGILEYRPGECSK